MVYTTLMQIRKTEFHQFTAKAMNEIVLIKHERKITCMTCLKNKFYKKKIKEHFCLFFPLYK